MTKQEAHKILDQCLDEAEQKKLYGQISFIMHYQAGKLQQITDEQRRRTWRNSSLTA